MDSPGVEGAPGATAVARADGVDAPPPTTGVFLTAEWRWLAMLNWEVDPAALRPWVPAGTELDTWDGVQMASMVGFLFLRTRVMGVPVPGHRDFEEVNLRFYVRRRGPEGWRRGVVFVREIVPRRAIAAVARLAYGERYDALPMRHRVDLSPDDPALVRDGGGVEYGWRHADRWSAVRVTTEGELTRPEPGSEEEFVTEHYWGYVSRRGRATLEYRVEHPQWWVWGAASAEMEAPRETLTALYGPALAETLAGGPPRSAFVAEGSPVVVRRGRRIA